MQNPVRPVYVMPLQQTPIQPPPNVIVAGSPVVSPSQVFPERYGFPPIGVMSGFMYPPYRPFPYAYPPPPFRPFGPYRPYGYPFPYY